MAKVIYIVYAYKHKGYEELHSIHETKTGAEAEASRLKKSETYRLWEIAIKESLLVK